MGAEGPACGSALRQGACLTAARGVRGAIRSVPPVCLSVFCWEGLLDRGVVPACKVPGAWLMTATSTLRPAGDRRADAGGPAGTEEGVARGWSPRWPGSVAALGPGASPAAPAPQHRGPR